MTASTTGRGELTPIESNCHAYCCRDLRLADELAFLFYFTHPGRRGADAEEDGFGHRRSSIQVVDLEVVDDWLECDREQPVRIRLLPPNDSE